MLMPSVCHSHIRSLFLFVLDYKNLFSCLLSLAKPFFAVYDKDGPKFGNVWQQLMETSAKDFDIMVEVFSVKSRQQVHHQVFGQEFI